jgi:hypothetical protein
VSAGVHGAGDALGQNAALSHGVSANDVGLIEVRPAGDLSTKGMSQVNKYSLTHNKFTSSKNF